MFGSSALPVQPSFYFVAQAGPWTSAALAPVSKVLSLQTQTIILGFLATLKTRFYFFFWGEESYHCAALASLQVRDPPPPCLQSAGLKVCSTMPSLVQ